MATVQEQINKIQTKDELIKWLINEYFTLSNKVYGKRFKETIDEEIEVIREKADEMMKFV